MDETDPLLLSPAEDGQQGLFREMIAMTHFKTEQWIDFVNEAVSTEAKRDMERHLAQGCQACNQTVSVWRKVRNAAKVEGNYEPPADAVRIAKAAFASSNLALGRERECTWAKVVFDSILQPAAEGARSMAARSRQMLYRADPYQIDVQIEMAADRRMLGITGQVLDLRQPGLTGRGALVVISNLRGQVVRATTNQFGEFRSEIPDSGNLELVFPGLTDKPVIIVLQDPLGRAAEESRTRSGRGARVRRKTGKKT